MGKLIVYSLGFALVVLMFFGGGRGSKVEERQGAASAPQVVVPTQVVSAESLSAAYESNRVAADDTYQGKILQVYGEVYRVDKTNDGYAYIVFKGKDDFHFLNALLLPSPKNGKTVLELSPGNIVEVRCASVEQLLGSPALIGCAIVSVNGR